jgi:hypothetical protein
VTIDPTNIPQAIVEYAEERDLEPVPMKNEVIRMAPGESYEIVFSIDDTDRLNILGRLITGS